MSRHICAATGRTPATSAPGLGLTPVHTSAELSARQVLLAVTQLDKLATDLPSSHASWSAGFKEDLRGGCEHANGIPSHAVCRTSRRRVCCASTACCVLQLRVACCTLHSCSAHEADAVRGNAHVPYGAVEERRPADGGGAQRAAESTSLGPSSSPSALGRASRAHLCHWHRVRTTATAAHPGSWASGVDAVCPWSLHRCRCGTGSIPPKCK